MSDASGAVFQLAGVRVERGGKPVLDSVDLAIEPGATALLGPSGSGKSTLLRLLNRLADPSAGTVSFRGTDVTELDPLSLRRRVAFVPQLPALLPGDVAGNVAAGHRFHGELPAPDVARCLERAGLGAQFAARPADELSVGEQQRVMLARALALEPEALLLDEPTSALDGVARDSVERALGELAAERSITIVLVTHDREQAGRLATRIAEIRDGRIVGSG